MRAVARGYVLGALLVGFGAVGCGAAAENTEESVESDLKKPSVAWKAPLPDKRCDWSAAERRLKVGADGTVYVGQREWLTAYTPGGTLKWSTQADGPIGAILVGGAEVYAIAGGPTYRALNAFDRTTGLKSVLYLERPVPYAPYSSGTFTVLRDRSDGRIELGPSEGDGFVFDPVTRVVSRAGRVDGVQLAGGAHAVVGHSGGPGYSLDKLDATGALLWRTSTSMQALGASSPTGTLYALDYGAEPSYVGELVGIDAGSGVVKWRSGHTYNTRSYYGQNLVLADGSLVLVHAAKAGPDRSVATLERRSASGALVFEATIPSTFSEPNAPRKTYALAAKGSTVYVSGDRLLRAYNGTGGVAWDMSNDPSGPLEPFFPGAMVVGSGRTIYGVRAPWQFDSQPQNPACTAGELMKLR